MVALSHLTDKILENTFMNGLDPIRKVEDQCWWLMVLKEMMKVAQLVENREQTKTEKTTTKAQVFKAQSPSTETKHFSSTTATRKDGPSRRMTDAEFQRRRDHGICLRCDEKLSAGHQCKSKKELLVLVAFGDEESEFEINEEMESEDTPVELQTAEVDDVAELSLNSAVGISSPGTIKLKGKWSQREVIILVNCGTTHNFIAQQLVDSLKLPHSHNELWCDYGHKSGCQREGRL